MNRMRSDCLSLLAFWAAGFFAVNGIAEEPFRAFLDGLRSRGYYDVALDYLEQVESKASLPDTFRELLDFERALTLIASSRSERDLAVRQRQLNQAQQLLHDFIGQRPDHLKANTARSQLGNLIAERARMRVGQAKKGNRRQLLDEARRFYEEARTVFLDHQGVIRGELEAIPKVLNPSDPDQATIIARRKQLRADYLQTELLATAILEEAADTAEPGSPQHSELLAEAAEKYESIYKRYRTRLAGLYARLYQGRVNQKLGKRRDALGFYVELLDQPDSPDAFRILKTKTLRLAVDCWLHESQNKYMEAIRRCSEWLQQARPEDEQNPDWLYLRLSLARAHLKRAGDAELGNNAQSIASRNEAEKQARIVAGSENEFQGEAQLIVARLSGRDLADRKTEVSDFVGAKDLAKESLDLTQAASASVADLEQQLADAREEKLRSDLQRRLDQTRQSLTSAHQDAIAGFRLALELADNETPAEDVNLVRYFLAYLYYLRQDYYEASLIGEFVARRYPDSTSARQCAKISLASLLQLHQLGGDDDKQFESDRIVMIAEYILAQWPEYPEAEEALATLVPFMINTKQLERARGYLAQLPDDSPQKGTAALKTGMALWQTYLDTVRERRLSADESANAPPADQAELVELRSAALQTLTMGIDRMPESAVIDKTRVAATLCLAQARLETGQAQQAIEMLETDRTGPLTLVRAKHPSTRVTGFVEDTYKTALRAYIGSLPGATNGGEVIQATRKIMEEMSAAFPGSPEGRQQLVRVYVGIARDLEEQLKSATPAARDALSQGFETFLAQLSGDATEPDVLNWVGETFASLGAGFDSGGAALDATAARYYRQSAAAFENLLQRVQLEPPMKTQVQVRLATIRRSQREYQSAMDLFRAALTENNRTLNVQIEAARTLQQWATAEQGPQRISLYERAIKGDFPTSAGKQHIVWGWGQIAKITANRQKFRDSFHAARLNLAKCRFGMAAAQQGAERQKLMQMAERDVTLTKRLYGLGSDRWTSQYDALLRQIQVAKQQPGRQE